MQSEKTCICCGETKPFDSFHKRSSMLDGYYNTCKVCRKSVSKDYYGRYKQTINEKSKIYNEINKDKKKQMDKIYYENNKESLLKENKKYRIKNRSTIKKQRYGYYMNNVDKIAEYKKWYYQTPQGKASRNKGNRKRKAMKKSQLHPLHNFEFEFQLELLRQRMENCLGIKHDLDHVWPLSQGGLHHIENLRIIPALINQRKHCDMTFEHPSVTMWYELPQWLIDDTVKWDS